MGKITIYSRPGCHLCEQVKQALASAQTQRGFELVEVNIEQDRELYQRYRHEIPVAELDGQEPVRYRGGLGAFLEALLGPACAG